MQFQWLEKWASEGLVSEAAKTKIYQDCYKIIKTAAPQSDGSWQSLKEDLTSAPIPQGLRAEAISEAILNPSQRAKTAAAQKQVFDKLSADPAFAKKASLLKERFMELAAMSPKVASDEIQAKKILAQKLDAGFTREDGLKLAVLHAAAKDQKPEINRQMKIAEKVGEAVALHFQLCKVAVESIDEEKTAMKSGLMGTVDAVKKLGPKLTSETMKNMVINNLAAASIPLLVGAGVGGWRSMMAKIDEREMKKRLEGSYASAMSAAQKDDRSILAENPAAAREAFTALSNFAPHVAAEPLAAKAFMSRIVAYNQGIGMEDIRTMSEIEKNIGTRRPGGYGGSFMGGFGEGASSMGLPKIMSDTIQSGYKPFLEHNLESIKATQKV